MRSGPGLGGILASQCDYFQTVKGGGHGDYRTIVLAPASVQETADLAYMSFDLAEKYRHPVIIATDGAIGEMIESVELPEMKEHDIDTYDWAIRPRKDGEKQRVIWNRFWDLGNDEYPIYLVNKYNEIEANEQRWESVRTEDAEIVLVAYGISSRVAKSAVIRARKEGMKLGLIRPITLWPFPTDAIAKAAEGKKGILCVELNAGQMIEDVRLAVHDRLPVEHFGRLGGIIPSPDEVLDALKEKIIK